MQSVRFAVSVVLMVGLVSCKSDGGATAVAVMPDVTGQKLDVALSNIQRAGFKDDVEIEGGGVFGVVKESNWQVCSQSPAAGQTMTDAPRLTVDRSCSDAAPEVTAPAPGTVPSDEVSSVTTQAPPPAVSEPAPSTSLSEQNLTVDNCEDLAALLAGSDSDFARIEAFATKYSGQTIEFDGNVAAISKHGDNETRYDILILAGDYSETSATGPYFQFQDVNITFDLHLTGANIPDSLGQGNNLHIVALVGKYNRTNGLFRLEPVSTEVR